MLGKIIECWFITFLKKYDAHITTMSSSGGKHGCDVLAESG